MSKQTLLEAPSFEMVASAHEQYPEFGLSLEGMRQLLNLSVEFDKNESILRGDYFRQQFADFHAAVQSIPGYRGVMGTGHPFYAFRPDGGVHAIEEYERHIGEAHELLSRDTGRAIGTWACASCQANFILPDLKRFCKPCDVTELKPREVFKRMPDLDFWIIVEKNSPQIEQLAEALLRKEGFYTSDEAIYPALQEITEVMQTLNDGSMPSARLPIDLHIVDEATMIQLMNDVPVQLQQHDDAFVPISPRSLHVEWEDTDTPYNFVKDFLFSMTPYGWSDELESTLALTRRQAKDIIGDTAVTRVSALAEKEARQLATPGLRDSLKLRIASW